MQKTHRVIAIAIASLTLVSCGQSQTLSTLSIEGDSEIEEIFSLTKTLDLGNSYLGTLDYQNAILQYTEILAHDPENKEAYAGVYAAYVAMGQDEKAEEILTQAGETLGDEDLIVDQILKDAELIYEKGGGVGPYQHLANWYLVKQEPLSEELATIGSAWLRMEPDRAEPYSLLGLYYAEQDNQDQLNDLLVLAEENGLDLNEIDAEIRTKSDGDYTIRLQIENLHPESAEVDIEAEDNAQDVVTKITEEVASDAADDVVEESGLEGEAADLAEKMAQDAIRQGLSSLPGGSLPDGFGF